MKIIKEFFFLNLNQYENIGLYFPIGVFLIFLCVATAAAVFFVTYYKSYTTTLYKQLLRHGATDEASAKTLKELRLDASLPIRRALSRQSGQITYIVKRVGDIKPSYEEYVENSKKRGYKPEKIDFDKARFYIHPERIDNAKKLTESGGAPLWRAILICLIILSILALLVWLLPDLLSAIDTALGK